MTTIEKPDWFFYPIWVILTTVCIPVAFIINLIILRVITAYVGDFIYVDGLRHITEDYLGMYTFVPIVGLITGLLQYGLLRRYLPHMGWWVLADQSMSLERESTKFLMLVVPTRTRA